MTETRSGVNSMPERRRRRPHQVGCAAAVREDVLDSPLARRPYNLSSRGRVPVAQRGCPGYPGRRVGGAQRERAASGLRQVRLRSGGGRQAAHRGSAGGARQAHDDDGGLRSPKFSADSPQPPSNGRSWRPRPRAGASPSCGSRPAADRSSATVTLVVPSHSGKHSRAVESTNLVLGDVSRGAAGILATSDVQAVRVISAAAATLATPPTTPPTTEMNDRFIALQMM